MISTHFSLSVLIKIDMFFPESVVCKLYDILCYFYFISFYFILFLILKNIYMLHPIILYGC